MGKEKIRILQEDNDSAQKSSMYCMEKESMNDEQLRQQLKVIWKSLPLEYAENLVENIDRRCQPIMDNEHDRMKYWFESAVVYFIFLKHVDFLVTKIKS